MTTLEDLIRQHAWRSDNDNRPNRTNEFRLSAFSIDGDGVHIYIHPMNANGDTLDYMVNGNILTPIEGD